MAVESLREKLSLRLSFVDSLVDGKEKIKTASFNKIKEDANDQNLYTSGQVLANLQTKELKAISKVEVSTLFE